MAAMYAPHALEPTRWVPGDGFQLQPDQAPYRLLRRQRFDFLSSRETLIFEGCRALYRPPRPAPAAAAPGSTPSDAAGDWVWDGALRIWVQVNFGPSESLLRRGAGFLCGATPLHSVDPDPRLRGAFNLLPEILDRRVHDDFEIVVLDLRGGRSLPDIREDGWPVAGVPSPFAPAGAIELLRRLIDLVDLAHQVGLCLPMLHPDQVMVDENLNLRIRGLPWLTPVDAAGRFPADWAAALAARAPQDLVCAPADPAEPDGRLCLRWLAAFVHYLVTGRWDQRVQPLPAWLAWFYAPGNPREPEPWEVGLFTRLTTAAEPCFPALAAELKAAVTGGRRQLTGAWAEPFCKSVTCILNEKLQEESWPEVLRLATVGSAPLPAVYRAAPSVDATASYDQLNRLLDQIARRESALQHATDLARHTPGAAPASGPSGPAGNTGMHTSAPGFRPSRFGDQVPLGPPTAAPPPVGSSPETSAARPRRTVMVNALGIPIAGPDEPVATGPATPRWQSPLKALAADLTDLPPVPAFTARLATWLPPLEPHFAPSWVDPPLTAAETATLTTQAPTLIARLPALLTTWRQAAEAELQAAAQAVLTGGARDLPRFDHALRAVLRRLVALSPAAAPSTTPDAPGAAPLPAELTAAEAAVAAVEAARKIDPAILARLIHAATADLPAARQAPRIGALSRLEGGLQAAQAAMAGAQALPALAQLRAALDEWPQYTGLQDRWRQALSACVLPAVAALERLANVPAAAPASGAESADSIAPATIAGLVDLLPGPAVSTTGSDRWLADWQPRIVAALRHFFERLTVRGGPLRRRLAEAAQFGPAFARFDPPAATAWQTHLEMTRQRRADLRAALAAGRAPAAWGKAVALWQSGETTFHDDLPADTADAARFPPGEDLGARALVLWLEQATQSINQLPPPADAATLAAVCDRLLTPLRQVAADRPVSVSTQDLNETIQAIEEDLFHRMVALTERPAQFDCWAELLTGPGAAHSPHWQAMRTPDGQALWQDWLAARTALADHRLHDAGAALLGAGPPPSPHDPPGARAERFATLIPAADRTALLDRFADRFDRQQAAQARAAARQNLDTALEELDADLQRLAALTTRAPVNLRAARHELHERRQQRDTARASAHRRKLAIDQALGGGRLAQAIDDLRLLRADWTQAELPPADLQQFRQTTVTALRARLQSDLVALEAAPASVASADRLSGLQICAAALAADRDGLWPNTAVGDATRPPAPPPQPQDLRPAIHARLTALHQACLAARAQERYGGALFAGLSTGALPPDAPFWAAVLQHHRPARAELETLRQLPVGALGPAEWRQWLAATQPILDAGAHPGLTDLRARVEARAAQLAADDTRLTTALTGAGPARQAADLNAFIARWRIGGVVQRRKEDLARVVAAAQTDFDAALAPPAGAWLTRPWRQWRALRAAREAATVLGLQTEHAAAERAALTGWLTRAVLAAAALALAAAALVFWLR